MKVDANDMKDNIPMNAKSCKTIVNNRTYTIKIERMKTGFGERRMFVCPNCGKMKRILYYLQNDFICAECGHYNPYKGIQNYTRGGDAELQYRMKRIAEKHGIEIEYPFDYMKFLMDKRLRRKSFRNVIIVLQSLENMRSNAIFFNVTYSNKVINQVIKGIHPLQSKLTLKELKEYFWNWNNSEPTAYTQKEFEH